MWDGNEEVISGTCSVVAGDEDGGSGAFDIFETELTTSWRRSLGVVEHGDSVVGKEASVEVGSLVQEKSVLDFSATARKPYHLPEGCFERELGDALNRRLPGMRVAQSLHEGEPVWEVSRCDYATGQQPRRFQRRRVRRTRRQKIHNRTPRSTSLADSIGRVLRQSDPRTGRPIHVKPVRNLEHNGNRAPPNGVYPVFRVLCHALAADEGLLPLHVCVM